MIFSFVLGILAACFTGISQVLLKLGAKRGNRLTIFFNFFTILGYALFFIVTLMNLYVYKILDIKYAVIFMPLAFMFVMIFSVLFLKEKLSKQKLIGIGIILFGICVFNLKI